MKACKREEKSISCFDSHERVISTEESDLPVMKEK